MSGLIFFAARVCEPDDGVTLYLGERVDADTGGRYKRETLDKAAVFSARAWADEHLTVFAELEAEIVELRGVTEPGKWRGWHKTDEHGGVSLHGPRGENLRRIVQNFGARGDVLPWTASHPDGRQLRDAHDRPRFFASAKAARSALQKATKN
jgi:hypothetical protein